MIYDLIFMNDAYLHFFSGGWYGFPSDVDEKKETREKSGGGEF